MIDSWLNPLATALLADLELFRGMGSGFRGKRAQFDFDDLLAWAGIVVGVVAVLWVLSRLLARQERFRRCSKPWPLFRDLCKAHELNRPQRRLMKQLARHHQLTHPGLLFVEGSRFEPAGLSAELLDRSEELRAIRERLFAWPASADQS